MTTNIKGILKSTGTYKVSGTIWIEFQNERCFGLGRMQLLQLIEKTGSINKAAKEMGMSYKKAWGMINSLNIQFNQIMVTTQSGGESGGGSVLTEAAKAIIKYHEDMRKRFQEFLEHEEKMFLEF